MTSCVCLPVGQKEASGRGEEQKRVQAGGRRESSSCAPIFEAVRSGTASESRPNMDLPPDVAVDHGFPAPPFVKRAYLVASPSGRCARRSGGGPKRKPPKTAERHREALEEAPATRLLRRVLTKLNVRRRRRRSHLVDGKALRAFPQFSMARQDEAADLGGSDSIPFLRAG